MFLFVKLALFACAPAPERELRLTDPPGGLGIPERAREQLRAGLGPRLPRDRVPDLPMALQVDDPRIPHRAWFGEGYSPMSELGERIRRARVDEDRGGELMAALDELPASRVAELGVAALTIEQIWGDTFHPGLCEDAAVFTDLELEGKDWVAHLSIPTFMEFVGDVEPYLTGLDAGCEAGILAAGGDTDAAMASGDCLEEDIRQFFPEGGGCRACVGENGGDFAACVGTEACPEEAPAMVWIEEEEGPVWYEMATAYIWACAPAETVLTLLLGHFSPGGEMPRPFDHENWSYLCLATWQPSSQSAEYTCLSGDGGPTLGHTLAEGVLGRVEGMWPEDEDGGKTHRNRLYYAPTLTMESGAEVRWFWGFSEGAGVISMPSVYPDSNGNGQVDIEDENYGFGYGGWGIDPYALRPDGRDPESLDDTQARDWLAAFTIKSATTRDGVSIHTFNFNRCLDWIGPDEQGSYLCTEMDIPTLGWQNDGQNTWSTSAFEQAYAFPVATIASTGLPDPEVPGGFVPLIAGSPALADPDWDDCVWPHSFVPDLVPMEDTPGGYGGSASVWAQSYRFGKDEDLDLRMVLNTNQARNFCPEEP